MACSWAVELSELHHSSSCRLKRCAQGVPDATDIVSTSLLNSHKALLLLIIALCCVSYVDQCAGFQPVSHLVPVTLGGPLQFHLSSLLAALEAKVAFCTFGILVNFVNRIVRSLIIG